MSPVQEELHRRQIIFLTGFFGQKSSKNTTSCFLHFEENVGVSRVFHNFHKVFHSENVEAEGDIIRVKGNFMVNYLKIRPSSTEESLYVIYRHRSARKYER